MRVGLVVAAALAASVGGGAIAAAPEATPLPFRLVTHSGRQAATELHATACPSASGCAVLSALGHPRLLSVVRPGERIRFDVPARVDVYGIFVQKLCEPFSLRPVALRSGTPSWTIHLRPGRYTAALLFNWSSKSGLVSENGTVGLLVSSSAYLQIVRAPSC